MGHNDYLDDDRPELPPEAGDIESMDFDPDDDWIKSAPKELQIEAMRRWFYCRFEDPANETPYESREGGYQFIWGGPYDPNDEIQERFGHVVNYDVMEELIQNLYHEVGDQWAPRDHGEEYAHSFYDRALAMLVTDRSDPYRMLRDRLTQIDAVLTMSGPPEATELTIQLAHGAAITALESYLWDTVAYWVAEDEQTLRTLVSTNKDFQTRTLELSKIFDRMDGLKKEVEVYLQDLIWHRLDKIKPLIEQGLSIKVPSIGDLMREILIRHDIVHRGGRNKDGEPITISVEDVRKAAASVLTFADEIEAELNKRY